MNQLEIFLVGSTIIVSGELDVWTAPQLRHALVEYESIDRGPPTLDLAGVSFMDSTGLRELLVVNRRTNPVLLNPSPRVTAMLVMTGIIDMFSIRRDNEAT